MYKKRFAKWGFQKYTKRSTGAVQTPEVDYDCTQPSTPRELASIPTSPGTCREDGLKLMFLGSVRTWNDAFFESAQLGTGCQVAQQQQEQQQPSTVQPRSVETKEISFAFKLVIDLLDRGHGELAGRMARKAFLLVEELLTLEGPALIWNLLELMHNMATLRHAQLFQMLLTHLDALVVYKMPETHPLPTMLRTLRRLVADPASGVLNTIDLLGSSALPSLLEQAWIFNAKMLFDHFDPELIQLYWCIFWDSCSIHLPSPIVDVAVQWLSRIESRHRISAAAKAYLADGALVVSDTLETLHATSIATLRERGNLILSKEFDVKGGTTRLLGIVAGLVTAKILEEGPPVVQCSSTVKGEAGMVKVPRMHAIAVACTIRILMDFSTDSGISDAVERMRMIVALREYVQGEADPQVVRDMWLLEDALITAGEHREAQEVKRELLRRLEEYVKSIPVGSA